MKPIKALLPMLACIMLLASNSSGQPGYINTIGGQSGWTGYSGDGGPALQAHFHTPNTLCVDKAGNVYIGDQYNNRVRKIDAVTNIVTTVIGTGTSGYSGDGGLGTLAEISPAYGMSCDTGGNLYIADFGNSRIRKLDVSTGIINTVAGGGTLTTDGIPATSAQLQMSMAVYVSPAGDIYLNSGGTIRKIDAATGIITTVAGGGTSTADGIPATSAQLSGLTRGIVMNSQGNLFFNDGDKIREVDMNTGIIHTTAGTGNTGFSGDGGLAVLAEFDGIRSIYFDVYDNMYVGDWNNYRIRKVNVQSGIVTTHAGGQINFADGVPALNTYLEPYGMCGDPAGNIYVCHNEAIRKINSNIASEVNSTANFDALVFSSCEDGTPHFIINLPSFQPNQIIKTYFGDGTSQSVNVTQGYGGGYAAFIHLYASSGVYFAKHILLSNNVPVDSVAYSFNYLLCQSYPVSLYRDLNNNCIFEPDTDILNRLPVEVEIDSNGVAIDTLSATGGFYYTANAIEDDIYSFRLISLPVNMVPDCPSTGILTDTIKPGPGMPKTMGITCPTGSFFDLNCNVNSFAGSHAFVSNIYPQNLYCAAQNAVLTMSYDPSYTSFAATPQPQSQSIGTATWSIPANSAMEQQQSIHVWLDGAQWPVGTPISTTYAMTPTTFDMNPADNIVIIIDTVVGGFDPNAIYVKPGGCVAAGTNLEYTITFENLGNGPAENIYVLDTLPSGLDASSMKMLFASHNMFIEKIYNGQQVIFKFNFPNIMLADSSDHANRHGSLKYSIDTKDNLTVGTNFGHRAGIYFDYNDPVMTNTAQTSICWPTNVNEAVSVKKNINIYPNPATEELTIKTEQSYTSYTITNSIGQVMMAKDMNGKESKVNIKSLSTGIYYISLKGEGGTEVRKFVKL